MVRNSLILFFLISFAIIHDSVALISFNQNAFRNRQQSYQASTSDSGIPVNSWITLGDCQVLLPVDQRIPNSVIHFIGGFVAGSVVSVGYSTMLQQLAKKGFLIIATPIPPLELNHGKVSNSISDAFNMCYKSIILPSFGTVGDDVPVIGLGHSLGGKLLALGSSKRIDMKDAYSANIFLAFNNFGAKDSIDMSTSQASKVSPELKKLIESINYSEIFNAAKNSRLGDFLSEMITDKIKENVRSPLGNILGNQLNDAFSKVDQFSKELEFNPGPEETWDILSRGYDIPENIMIRFDNDDIDQSLQLVDRIRRRGMNAKLITIPGSHITPNAFDETDPSFALFLRELVFQLNKLVEEAPIKKSSRRVNDKFYLPGSPPSGTGAGRWNSDDF